VYRTGHLGLEKSEKGEKGENINGKELGWQHLP
jgi:hypothetical protein